MKLDLNELCGLTKKHQKFLMLFDKISKELDLGTDTKELVTIVLQEWQDELNRVGDILVRNASYTIQTYIKENCKDVEFVFRNGTDTFGHFYYDIWIEVDGQDKFIDNAEMELGTGYDDQVRELINIIKSHKK